VNLKENDVVTLDLGKNSKLSNAYHIHRKLDGESILSHPLAPQCLIIKKDSELNTVLGHGKSTHQRCLEYVKRNKQYLSYHDKCEIDALCLYFVVYKNTTPQHRHSVSLLCEVIAKIYCQGSLNRAYKILKENKPVIQADEFNERYYALHEKFIEGIETKMTDKQISTIYRLVGFSLAQIESYE
jgi:hypothetical protein